MYLVWRISFIGIIIVNNNQISYQTYGNGSMASVKNARRDVAQ